MNSTTVRRISFYSQWLGFANPCCRTSRLHLTNRNGELYRMEHPDKTPQVMPATLIDKLLGALSEPTVPAPDLLNMGLNTTWLQEHAPALTEAWSRAAANEQSAPSLEERFHEMVDEHFGCVWTDDYPGFRIKIVNDDGSCLIADSEAQHAFMIPWILQGSAGSTKTVTFNAHISRAVACLLPDDFLNRERLLGEGLAFAARLHMATSADDQALNDRARLCS